MLENGLPHTALITGGSSGIGRAIAEAFFAEGMQVAIADKDQYKGEVSLKYKKCDVGRGTEIDELYSWCTEAIGQPEILVINAGRGIQEKLTEGDPEKWQEIINTNLMGALRCIRAFVPAMLKQQRGNVVIISSVSAEQPHPYGGVYSATKTALEVVAETLRLETLPHINVTVVCPGVTDTAFFENQLSGNTNIKDLNMGAISPEEIAQDVLYAIKKKKGTSINKIITRPLEQSF